MDNPVTILVVLAIIVFVFLICREFVCWYFKLNEMVRLLGVISEQLTEIAKQNSAKNTPAATG